MRKCANISPNMRRRPLVIFDFPIPTDPVWISLYMRKILFYFVSVYMPFVQCGFGFIWLHCKKRLVTFPSPAGMSLTKLSLAGNNLIITKFSLGGNNLIIPAQGEFGNCCKPVILSHLREYVGVGPFQVSGNPALKAIFYSPSPRESWKFLMTWLWLKIQGKKERVAQNLVEYSVGYSPPWNDSSEELSDCTAKESYLCIHRIGPHIFLQENGLTDSGSV